MQQAFVTEDFAGERLDSALVLLGLFESRSGAAKAIEAGKVTVNGKAVPKRTLVAVGDDVTVEEPDAAPEPIKGADIPLDIRYEDEHLLVISKQVGLVCHPDEAHTGGTLVEALVAHCGADHLSNVSDDPKRLGIVHRLDKNTSGLMLAAKTDEAALALMEAIKERTIDRRYIALVHGGFSGESGIIDAPVARSAQDRKKMAVRECESSREAITTYKILGSASAVTNSGSFPYSMVECKLNTGRTHQIRVHMEFTKHPVVGDPVYHSSAPKAQAAKLGLQRQFLHSYRIQFTHPITGELLTFVDDMPEDLKAALANLDETRYSTTEYGREVFAALAAAPKPAIQGQPN